MVHTYALILTFDNAGQFSQNILHYQFDDSGYTDTASAALALINSFNAHKLTAWQAILPATVIFLSAKARCIDTTGGFEAVVPYAGGTAGGRTGTQQDSAVGPVGIVFPISNAKPRGKIFLCGATDVDLIDGIFATTFVNNFTTFANAQLGTLALVGGGAPTATYGVYSRKPIISFHAAEYIKLSPIPGTLRKRQRPY